MRLTAKTKSDMLDIANQARYLLNLVDWTRDDVRSAMYLVGYVNGWRGIERKPKVEVRWIMNELRGAQSWAWRVIRAGKEPVPPRRVPANHNARRHKPRLSSFLVGDLSATSHT